MEFVGNNHDQGLLNCNGDGMEPDEEEGTEIYTCGQCCKVFVQKYLLDQHLLEQHQQQPSEVRDPDPESLAGVDAEEFILGFGNEADQFFDQILQEVQMGTENGDNACTWFDEEIINGIVLNESEPSTSALQVQASHKQVNKAQPQPPSTVELSREEVDRIAKVKMHQEEARQRELRVCLEDIGRSLRVRCESCNRRIPLAKLTEHERTEHCRPNAAPKSRQRERLNGTTVKTPRKCYKCSFCGKAFVVPSQCKSHENTHRAVAEGTGEGENELPTATEPAAPCTEPEPEINASENENRSQMAEEPESSLPNCIEPEQVFKEPAPVTAPSNEEGSKAPSPKRKSTTPASLQTRRPSKPDKLGPMKENYIASPSVESPDALQTCLECGEEVPMSGFVSHIYQHIVKNQRQCPLCEHRAYTILDLKDHITGKHYGLKPHICTMCGSGFSWRSGLRGHEENCPANGRPKVFKCSGCKARFGTNRERRRHELVHKSLSGPEPGDKVQAQTEGALGCGPAPRLNVNINGGGVLKTKHNILSKKPTKPTEKKSKHGSGCGLGFDAGSNSPELTSLLENYVKDPREEHLIELDPMTERYSESFLQSLTRPGADSVAFGGREETVAVAFASMNSAAVAGGGATTNGGVGVGVVDGGTASAPGLGGYGMQVQTGQQNWGAGGPPPAGGLPNNAHTHHVLSNSSFVAPSLIQQPLHHHHQNQPPMPMQQQQLQFHPNQHPIHGAAEPSAPTPIYNKLVIKSDPDADGSTRSAGSGSVLDDGDGGEEDDDEDDEYYREEDKRYTEPADTRVSETCKTCNQVVSMSALREHIQSHVTKGQLECSICNYKAFNGKYLLDHLNIHYALKPYECERCGRHFTFHGYLRSHIKQVHMQSKNRPHECRYCDKKFVRPCHRRTHERNHKGEVPKDKRPPSLGSTPTSTPTPPGLSLSPAQSPGFRTPPVKRESFDMTPDLLSSPSPSRMTASWPPIAPQHQDPWLNPIHHSNANVNQSHPPAQQMQPQPHHHQQPSVLQQTLQYSSTGVSGQPPPPPNQNPFYQPQLSGPGHVYHQQQQQQQSMYAQGQGPQLQQQRPPPPAPIESQGPLPSFGSTYAHAAPHAGQAQYSPQPPQQRLPPPPGSWGPPQPQPAQNQHQAQASPARYPQPNANANAGPPPTGGRGGFMQSQAQAAPTPGTGGANPYYHAYGQQHPPSQPLSACSAPVPVPPPAFNKSHGQGPPNNAGYSNSNGNRFGHPSAPAPPQHQQPPPVYAQQQQDFGYSQSQQHQHQHQQQPPLPDYSISAPSTSTFDLWAELRDEEMRLFPETNSLFSDPFASPSHASSFLRNDTDPMLTSTSFYGDPPAPPQQHGHAPQAQQQFNNFYAQDPFANPTAALAPTAAAAPTGYGPPPTNSVPPPTTTPVNPLQHVPRVKVKIRRRNGQAILLKTSVPHHPQIKQEPGTAGNASTSASRELIPAGGRRLSSDDLEELQLTNSKCLVCKASLSGGQDILEHIASHLPRGGTHCSICDRSFAHSWYLKVHTYKHYGIKLYECTHCQRKFSKRHSLTAHIEQTHSSGASASSTGAGAGTGDTVCGVCNKKLSSRFALRRHQKDVHGAVLKPDATSTAVPWAPGIDDLQQERYVPAHKRAEAEGGVGGNGAGDEELEIRVQGAHLNVFLRGWTVRLEDIGDQTRQCPICKEAVPIRKLLTHKTEHTETCHICGKEVPASEIISHGSTHVSSLYCELCNWKGKQKSQIWEHMNGHLGNKPLKCEYCGVGFASRSSVRLHTIARHTNIRLHKCDFCDARFVTPQVKRMHQLQHYDTNCPYCNKYFALKKDLAVHIRRHYKMAGQKLVLKEDGDGDVDDEEEQNQNGTAGGTGSAGPPLQQRAASLTDYDTSSNTSTSNTGSMLSLPIIP